MARRSVNTNWIGTKTLPTPAVPSDRAYTEVKSITLIRKVVRDPSTKFDLKLSFYPASQA